MKNKIVSLLLAALILCLLSFSALGESSVITVTDMKDREITFNEPAGRVVALTASDCEILYALGAGDLLVGRGEYCDYPADVLTLPVVQSGSETNIEQIIALEPQAVFLNTMAQTKEQVEALEAAGIHVIVSDAKTIDEVYTSIRLIGAVVGKAADADELVVKMQFTFDEVSQKAAGDFSKTVYFEVSPLQWGLWTAGSGTFMNELASMLGLTNAFADVNGWGEISQEQVIMRDPDYIVTVAMYFGEGITPVDEILQRDGWQDLKAVKNNAVLNIDSNEIARPGPRLMNAAQALYQFISKPETVAP